MFTKRRKTWYLGGAAIALFGLIALALSSDYLFGFSTSNPLWGTREETCLATAFGRTGTEYRLLFVDASTKRPIACETVKIYEEDPLCDAGDCPTFLEAHSGQTAQDGTVAVPVRKMPGRIFRPTEGSGEKRADQNPLYAFDADDYIHTEIPYQSIADSLEHTTLTIELQQGFDNDARWQSDY